MDSVVVCTPSRGLVHSRTVDAVLVALDHAACSLDLLPRRGRNVCGWWQLTHDLPIPAAQNAVTRQALATGASLLWFVEEDMLPPPTALSTLYQTLQNQRLDAVGLDYTLDTTPPQNTIGHDVANGVLWLGLGCTLFRRRVFEVLPYPWFRADVVYYADALDTPVAAQPGYGGQDVYLSRQMAAAGLRMGQVPADDLMCGHLRLRALGEPSTNDGAHTIELLPAPQRWH